MTRRYDAVVAGAGCSGALFAARLASRGRSVLLLDRRPGRELGPDTRSLVDPAVFGEAGVERLPPPAAAPPGSIVAVSPDTAVRLSVDNPGLVLIDRRDFAASLLETAVRAGVEVRTGCLASGLEIEGGSVVGVRTEEGPYRCSIAVDATAEERALCGRLPSAMGIPRKIRTSDRLLVYQELRAAAEWEPESEVPSGELEYHIGRFGGFGAVHRGQGIVDVKVAVKAAAAAPDPREIARGYIRSNPGIGARVAGSAGGRVAARRPLDTMVSDGLMLIGDSACQATPLTGRGVEGALLAASLAADVAGDALDSGDCGTAALWRYNREYIAGRGSEAAALDCMRIFIQRLTEEEVCRLMSTGVAGPREVRAALEGRVSVPSMQARAKNMIRAVRELPLLVRAQAVLRNARRARELYASYPASFDPPGFTEWRQEAAYLFEDVERG